MEEAEALEDSLRNPKRTEEISGLGKLKFMCSEAEESVYEERRRLCTARKQKTFKLTSKAKITRNHTSSC